MYINDIYITNLAGWKCGREEKGRRDSREAHTFIYTYIQIYVYIRKFIYT